MLFAMSPKQPFHSLLDNKGIYGSACIEGKPGSPLGSGVKSTESSVDM